jgi:hypothetical protein
LWIASFKIKSEASFVSIGDCVEEIAGESVIVEDVPVVVVPLNATSFEAEAAPSPRIVFDSNCQGMRVVCDEKETEEEVGEKKENGKKDRNSTAS